MPYYLKLSDPPGDVLEAYSLDELAELVECAHAADDGVEWVRTAAAPLDNGTFLGLLLLLAAVAERHAGPRGLAHED